MMRHKLNNGLLILAVFTVATVVVSSQEDSTKEPSPSYGLGCSWPLQDGTFTCDESTLPGLEQQRHNHQDYIHSCADSYGSTICQEAEELRVYKNSIKPLSMRNYTEHGYKKVQVPSHIMEPLLEVWNKHRHDNYTEYITREVRLHYSNNAWAVPSELANVNVDGYELPQRTLLGLQPIFEEWTGHAVELRPTSMYGIRVYHRDTIIVPHVDREPLVLSAIINVDQEVEEQWPLEVIDRSGKAVNVTLQPGEMVMYEGHSTIHSRPFPLQGNFYANAFVHYEPTGRPRGMEEEAKGEDHIDTTGDGLRRPPYLIPDSPWEPHWFKDYPNGWQFHMNPTNLDEYPIEDAAWVAAVYGNVPKLEELVQQGHGELLVRPNPHDGMQPIHQAVVRGRQKALEVLLKHGADINALTHDGDTPLSLMLNRQQTLHRQHHPIVTYLIEHGALRPDQLVAAQAAESSEHGTTHDRNNIDNNQQVVPKRTKKKRRRRRRKRF